MSLVSAHEADSAVTASVAFLTKKSTSMEIGAFTNAETAVMSGKWLGADRGPITSEIPLRNDQQVHPQLEALLWDYRSWQNTFMSADKETTEFDPALLSGPTEADTSTPWSFNGSGIELAAQSHCGHVRKGNEDRFVVIRRTRSGEVLATNLNDALPPDTQHAWLLAVADGLGGEVAGDVASEIAIRTLVEFASGLGSWIMRPTDGLREDFAERVDLYIKAIQRELRLAAQADPNVSGMATTLTVVYVFGKSAIVVNVGDSRSYLIRSNQMFQVTQDHTVAQDMLNEGHSQDAARPFRNVLTRCFTADSQPMSIDLFHINLKAGDQFLLCSDGLSDMVDDDVILKIATSGSSTASQCERLVGAALPAGGRDNVTVISARIVDLNPA